MNQSNVVSLKIAGAALAGDVMGLRSDASVVKMDQAVGLVTSANVSTTDDSFTIPGHQLVTGDKIKYLKGSGSAAGGLTDTTPYYAIATDVNTFSVATNLSNALSGTAVTITSTGGNTHTFTHQIALAQVVGVLLHDVDTSETGTAAAIQLFNHGIFLAHTKGDVTVERGDQLEAVANSSLLEAGTTTVKGLALDRLPEKDFTPYSATATYAVGDTVTNSSKNYACINANGAAAFVAGDWEELSGVIRVLSV
jgi:hypothetical protein